MLPLFNWSLCSVLSSPHCVVFCLSSVWQSMIPLVLSPPPFLSWHSGSPTDPNDQSWTVTLPSPMSQYTGGYHRLFLSARYSRHNWLACHCCFIYCLYTVQTCTAVQVCRDVRQVRHSHSCVRLCFTHVVLCTFGCSPHPQLMHIHACLTICLQSVLTFMCLCARLHPRK